MKAHLGVEARTGRTHNLTTTAANKHDLLHGEEADADYRKAQESSRQKICYIAERLGKVRILKERLRINKVLINTECLKTSIRAKVKHPFRIIKCQFGFIKARYRRLVKNGKPPFMFTLTNIVRLGQLLRS